VIDTRAIGPRVNVAILRELARRAELGPDPLQGMEARPKARMMSGSRRRRAGSATGVR
jgi:hypothetical protein